MSHSTVRTFRSLINKILIWIFFVVLGAIRDLLKTNYTEITKVYFSLKLPTQHAGQSLHGFLVGQIDDKRATRRVCTDSVKFLKKSLKFALQFSRPGTSLEDGDKVWKKGKK